MNEASHSDCHLFKANLNRLADTSNSDLNPTRYNFEDYPLMSTAFTVSKYRVWNYKILESYFVPIQLYLVFGLTFPLARAYIRSRKIKIDVQRK